MFAGFTEQIVRLIPRVVCKRVEGQQETSQPMAAQQATNLGAEERLMRHFLILAMAYGCVVASPAEAAPRKKAPRQTPSKRAICKCAQICVKEGRG